MKQQFKFSVAGASSTLTAPVSYTHLKLLASPKLFGYVDWALSVPGSFLYKIFWIFGDLTEAVAYKSLIASLLFIVGCFVAHWLCRNKPSLKIYPITLGLGVLPWVILGALVGVATSVFVYSFMFTYSPMWIPKMCIRDSPPPAGMPS